MNGSKHYYTLSLLCDLANKDHLLKGFHLTITFDFYFFKKE